MAEFVTKSTREAAALGQSWVGAEHLLLALTKDRQVGPLLTELGLTHNRLADYLRVRRPDPPVPSLEANQLPRPNPRLYRVMGWAEGFAAERGAEPSAADWLLAAIFEDISESGLGGLNRAGSKSQVYFDAEEGIDLSGMLAEVREARVHRQG